MSISNSSNVYKVLTSINSRQFLSLSIGYIHDKQKWIKYIKTDNGTEFFNNNFEKFYNESGIVHQYTILHNLQQHGRVERLNGTLVSLRSTLLADAKLNHKFWEEGVAIANYIHNRVPHKGINNKIPYEVLTGNKVDYNRFKVFGC